MDCYENYLDLYNKHLEEAPNEYDVNLQEYVGWVKSTEKKIVSNRKNWILHSEDDNTPAYISPYSVLFQQNGNDHRMGGPAVLTKDGSWTYRQNDLLHRLDGPADFDTAKKKGRKYSWWINDICKTDQVYDWANASGIDPLNMSQEEKILFVFFMSGFL